MVNKDNVLRNTSLNNYFMKPTIMDNGLILYPINIYDYEYFRLLASEYIILDVLSRNNLQRQQFITNRKQGLIPNTEKYKKLKFINIFDFLIAKINQDEKIKQIQENVVNTEQMKKIYKDDTMVMDFIKIAEMSKYENILNNILNLFYMVTKIIPIYTEQEFIFQYENNQYIIDRENFYEFREIVMQQNVLFEPRVAPDPESQMYIDSENKNNNEFDLEAIISFISVNCGLDVSNYTYYRLLSDYTTKLKTISYEGVSIYRANGCKTQGNKDIEYPNMAEHLSMKDNPYSKENIYKSSEITEFDKKLMKNGK